MIQFNVIVLSGPGNATALREDHQKLFNSLAAAQAYARARVTLAGGAPVAMVWEASDRNPMLRMVAEFNSVERRRFLESLAAAK